MADVPGSNSNQCHLAELKLPKNDANTCWWLSANLALFHRKRPEWVKYFNAKRTNPGSNEKQEIFDLILSSNYFKLADYYSTGKPTYDMSKLVEQRKAETMGNIFNTKSFEVDGNDMQSSDEYITTLSQYIGLDRGLIPINTGNAVTAYETSAYDIYLHAKYFGHTLSKSNVDVAQISSDVNTLILTFARVTVDPENPNKQRKTSIPVSPLKTMTIPTFDVSKVTSHSNMLQFPYTADDLNDKTVTSMYYLDAMIVYEVAHYVAYVKCESSDSWFYYKALKEGTLGNTSNGNEQFETFESMMELHGNKIIENCTHLFYTKASAEQAQLAQAEQAEVAEAEGAEEAEAEQAEQAEVAQVAEGVEAEAEEAEGAEGAEAEAEEVEAKEAEEAEGAEAEAKEAEEAEGAEGAEAEGAEGAEAEEVEEALPETAPAPEPTPTPTPTPETAPRPTAEPAAAPAPAPAPEPTPTPESTPEAAPAPAPVPQKRLTRKRL